MKKFTSILLAALMTMGLVACGSETTTESEKEVVEEVVVEEVEEEEVVEEIDYYALGDTVSTDIMQVTLHEAEFAIALENSINDDYYTPKEYSASEDSKNPFVAGTGKSLIYLCATIENLDRSDSLDLGGVFNPGFIFATYQDETQFLDVDFKFVSENGGDYKTYTSSNILVSSGSYKTVRMSGEFGTEPDSLDDSFILTIKLINSDDEWEEFLFEITAEDREAIEQAAATEAASAADATAELELALQGTWVLDRDLVSMFTFADGEFSYQQERVSDGGMNEGIGTYEILDDAVSITYPSASSPVEIPYTYENGVMSLTTTVGGEPVSYLKQDV